MPDIEWRPEIMDHQRTFVPEHLRGGIVRFIEQGIDPGNGLRHILENGLLSEIIPYLDEISEGHLGSIYRFLYNGVGSPAWGSRDKVKAWIERGGLKGK